MKIICKFLFVLAFLFLNILATEAATIAMAPLTNKVVFATPEEENVPNRIFFDVALDVIKNKQGYRLVDNGRLQYAMEKNIEKGKLPGKEQLQEISKKSNVDIIVAMELTNYGQKLAHKSANEINYQMDVKANLVAYNRLTGKFISKKCVDDSIIDATLGSRWDLVKEAWIKLVRREFNSLTASKRK
ncbi:MAG: hypothetical protein MJ032_01480 [Acidaminococcaceae bacterium]|nr:hypothetical protein [Acidaminococcaceae bacterium]